MSRSEIRAVALLVSVFACGYALFGLFQHWSFRTSIDLGIFDQAVWHLSRFEAPASSITGLSNILGDHFYPILGLFAPLYWIAPAPEILIVAQALLLASSIVPVFLFVRTRLPHGAAVALCLAYAFSWGLQQTAASDFHEMAFAPLLLATAILVMDRREWKLLWTVCLILVVVKEDLIPVITFLGLYLVVQGERKAGLLLVTSSLVTFFLIVGFLIPWFADSGHYRYAGGYADILRKPWLLPVQLVTPPYKLRTAFLWLAPFVFVSLRSPLSVLLVPLALERFLSATPLHWGTAFHHSAPVAPIVAMSAADGLARMARGLAPGARSRTIVGVTAASALLSSILPGHQPLWRLLSPNYYQETAFVRTGYRVLGLIPQDASVVAQAAVMPHLSQRHQIHVLDQTAPEADFVIAGAELNPWPAPTYQELSRLIDERRRRGYTVVFEEDGWVLLRRERAVERTRS